MFAVRIVTADYYIASPLKDLDVCHSDFRESDVKKVPVVRIFGATPAGSYSHLFLIANCSSLNYTPCDVWCLVVLMHALLQCFIELQLSGIKVDGPLLKIKELTPCNKPCSTQCSRRRSFAAFESALFSVSCSITEGRDRL